MQAITNVRWLVCASKVVGANIALMPRNTVMTCGRSASALGVGNTPRPCGEGINNGSPKSERRRARRADIAGWLMPSRAAAWVMF